MRDRIRYEFRNRRPSPDFNPLTDDGFVDQYGTYFGVNNDIARGKQPSNNNGHAPKQEGKKLWLPKSL